MDFFAFVQASTSRTIPDTKGKSDVHPDVEELFQSLLTEELTSETSEFKENNTLIEDEQSLLEDLQDLHSLLSFLFSEEFSESELGTNQSTSINLDALKDTLQHILTQLQQSITNGSIKIESNELNPKFMQNFTNKLNEQKSSETFTMFLPEEINSDKSKVLTQVQSFLHELIKLMEKPDSSEQLATFFKEHPELLKQLKHELSSNVLASTKPTDPISTESAPKPELVEHHVQIEKPKSQHQSYQQNGIEQLAHNVQITPNATNIQPELADAHAINSAIESGQLVSQNLMATERETTNTKDQTNHGFMVQFSEYNQNRIASHAPPVQETNTNNLANTDLVETSAEQEFVDALQKQESNEQQEPEQQNEQSPKYFSQSDKKGEALPLSQTNPNLFQGTLNQIVTSSHVTVQNQLQSLPPQEHIEQISYTNTTEMIDQINGIITKYNKGINGIEKITIQIYPQELGRIDLELQFQQNRITADFIVSNEMLKEVIETSFVALADQVESKGITVEKLEAKTEKENADQKKQQHEEHQQKKQHKQSDQHEHSHKEKKLGYNTFEYTA